MKKNELNDFDFIKGKFEEAKPTVPQGLDEDNIKRLINSGSEHKRIKFEPKRSVRPFAAIAACIALVIGLMVVAYPFLSESPITTDPNSKSNVSIFNSDETLNAFIKSLNGGASERGCGNINHAYEINGNDKILVAEKEKVVGNYIYEAVVDYAPLKCYVNIYKNTNGKKQLVYTIYDALDASAYIDSLVVYNDRLILSTSTYDVSDEYGSYNYKTMIRIYDVSNPESPALVSEFTQSGSNSKMYVANDILYVITDFCVSDFDEDQTPRSGLNGEYDLVKPESIAYFEHITQREFLVISALNPQTGEAVKETRAVLGAYYVVYFNENNIYFTDTNYLKYDEDESNDNNERNIIRLSITGDEMEFAAAGKIDGVPFDDCGINEYGGYVRILVTQEAPEFEYTHEPEYSKTLISQGVSKIYVLDSELNIVGESDDILTDNTIEKIGFDGDKAYITTFGEENEELEEPSLVVDFTNPIAPIVKPVEK